MSMTRGLLLLAVFIVFVALFTGCGQVAPPAATPDSSGQKEIEDLTGVSAVIEMENGDKITLELYPEFAPETVGNFVSLARAGFYDSLTFHRVIKGFMIQGGDPDGNGTGGPGYGIKGEFAQNGVNNPLKHERGVISMARSNDPNSAGSQFFIMHADAPHLDGAYAAFGKVTEGIEAVDAIAQTPVGPNGETPEKKPVIKSITIIK